MQILYIFRSRSVSIYYSGNNG